MKRALSKPYVKKIDALQIPVPDLDIGLAFYRDRLGHELVWRSETAAGLRMPDTDGRGQRLGAPAPAASVAAHVTLFSCASNVRSPVNVSAPAGGMEWVRGRNSVTTASTVGTP